MVDLFEMPLLHLTTMACLIASFGTTEAAVHSNAACDCGGASCCPQRSRVINKGALPSVDRRETHTGSYEHSYGAR